MVTVEELITKVQRANEIIQKSLTENDIIELPVVENVTGIIIFRLVHGKGIYTTCIGAVDFKIAIKALKDWEQVAPEYDIRNSE